MSNHNRSRFIISACSKFVGQYCRVISGNLRVESAVAQLCRLATSSGCSACEVDLLRGAQVQKDG